MNCYGESAETNYATFNLVFTLFSFNSIVYFSRTQLPIQ